ncbi:hypothetical protein RJT34_32531 [Clitoria ternatea]|uniref:Uncharacterized protein n=1 Tax=Clitoria ternatea TaxID=43366 RepID=A0AAN9F476_CLITE
MTSVLFRPTDNTRSQGRPLDRRQGDEFRRCTLLNRSDMLRRKSGTFQSFLFPFFVTPPPGVFCSLEDQVPEYCSSSPITQRSSFYFDYLFPFLEDNSRS